MKNRLTPLAIGLLLVLTSSALTYAVSQTNFPDVDSNAWYSNGVDYVSNAGLMTGYQNGNFGPENPVLRGELATVLQRFNENLSAIQTTNFTNVLCDLGKKVKLYEHPTTNQILYGVGDFSSGVVEITYIYNTAGERVGGIVPSDVEDEGISCTLNGEKICASFQKIICEGTEGF